MKAWLRRSLAGLVATALAVTVYIATVAYPMWRENLGRLEPAITIPAGATARVDGVLWRMYTLDMPAPQHKSVDPPVPPHTRLVSYAFDRSKDGKPDALGGGWTWCGASLVDERGRRWLPGVLPMAANDWLTGHGYASICTEPGSFAVVATVPDDARISAIEVMMTNDTDGKRLMRFITPE